jgi:Zn finger protein HypA/HybF involved in hydrogenase expression
MAEELVRWPEKPKADARPEPADRPRHRLEWAIGYCPECKGIKTRGDPDEVLQHLRDIREFYTQHYADSPFECKNCHAPLPAKEKADLEKIEGCPLCGSTEAIMRSKKA